MRKVGDIGGDGRVDGRVCVITAALQKIKKYTHKIVRLQKIKTPTYEPLNVT